MRRSPLCRPRGVPRTSARTRGERLARWSPSPARSVAAAARRSPSGRGGDRVPGAARCSGAAELRGIAAAPPAVRRSTARARHRPGDLRTAGRPALGRAHRRRTPGGGRRGGTRRGAGSRVRPDAAGTSGRPTGGRGPDEPGHRCPALPVSAHHRLPLHKVFPKLGVTGRAQLRDTLATCHGRTGPECRGRASRRMSNGGSAPRSTPPWPVRRCRWTARPGRNRGSAGSWW